MSRNASTLDFDQGSGPVLSDSDEFDGLSDDFGADGEETQTGESVTKVDTVKQQEMRKLIMEISNDPNIPAPLKAKKIQELMTLEWKKKQPIGIPKKLGDDLTEEDLSTTYHASTAFLYNSTVRILNL
ncbi:hypothetical protein K7432_008953 [Basidiobolus ranarum]|uniref:Uncharacterized protein n=1 Tax=Basidiobolus ranarum TaxID=34480 RepID=A0ABR2WR75_9FUNG